MADDPVHQAAMNLVIATRVLPANAAMTTGLELPAAIPINALNAPLVQPALHAKRPPHEGGLFM
jgi:hypothetical protein